MEFGENCPIGEPFRMLSHLRSSACFETSADSLRTFVLVNENKSTEKNTSTG